MSYHFQSRWSTQFAAFVHFKQALGQPYARSIKVLHSFDRLAASTQWRDQCDLVAVLTAWLSQYSNRKPVTVTNYLATFRQFCQFRRRYDPAAFVPDRSWAPQATESVFFALLLFDERDSPDHCRHGPGKRHPADPPMFSVAGHRPLLHRAADRRSAGSASPRTRFSPSLFSGWSQQEPDSVGSFPPRFSPRVAVLDRR